MGKRAAPRTASLPENSLPNDSLPAGDWRPVAFLALMGVVLLWDVLLAGQIARSRGQRRGFLALTAICGLFVAPAAAVALAASTMPTAQAVHLAVWLWPATLAVYVLQSGYALVVRLVTPLVALPIFLLNLVLCVAAVARYADGLLVDLPSPVVGAAVAQAAALGTLLGKTVLWSPLVLQLPLLAPAYPARWRISRSFRALVAASAAAWVVLIAVEYPRSVHAARTYADFGAAQLQERPNDDFALGLRILPMLRAAPPELALQNDLALADTLDVAVLSVVVNPDGGASPRALDSLANALADVRRDSVLLAVTLGWGARDGELYRRSPARFAEHRLALLEQVVRRVRPDVLLPALDPLDAGQRTLGDVSLGWWRDYLARSAALAHRLRPRTRVGVAASSLSAADSALYAWAARTAAIDLVGFSIAPSYGGGSSLAARLRIAERWMRQSRKEHWIFSLRTFPRIFGEANQERAVWGTLAWATTQPRIRVMVIDGAADYETLVGLRAPGGRLRPVVASVGRARRAMEEAR